MYWTIYNVYLSLPNREGHCDLDGAALVQQADDTESVFEEWMRTYHSSSAPVIEHYRALGPFIEMDGDRSIGGIAADIVAAVDQGIPPHQASVAGTAGAPYTVTPDLPGGLTLDPASGTISGTPASVSAATIYTVVAGNGAGAVSTTVQITVEPAGTVLYQILAIQGQTQQHDEWCWAADCSSILDFLGNPQTQCNIVNSELQISDACQSAPFSWSNYANTPTEDLFVKLPSTCDALARFGVPATGQSAALPFSAVQTEIGANRPFIFRWLWVDDGGHHQLVAFGWDLRNGFPEMYYMDPWVGDIKSASYDWVCNGTEIGRTDDAQGTHSWVETLTLNP